MERALTARFTRVDHGRHETARRFGRKQAVLEPFWRHWRAINSSERWAECVQLPACQGAAVRLAIVVSRFNDFVTERLLTGAQDAIREAGVPQDDLEIFRVPGAFEIPIAAQRVAETGRVAAVVCLGCLIRGETPHFEYIASACAHGITAAAAATGIPMTFGVLTTNSIEEALERSAPGQANKGREAAIAALDMARLLRGLDGSR